MKFYEKLKNIFFLCIVYMIIYVENKFTKIRKLKNEDILLNLDNILSNIINKFNSRLCSVNLFAFLSLSHTFNTS